MAGRAPSDAIDIEDDDDEVVFLFNSSQRPSDPDARKRKTPLFTEASPPTSPEASSSRPFKKRRSVVISLEDEDDDEDFSIVHRLDDPQARSTGSQLNPTHIRSSEAGPPDSNPDPKTNTPSGLVPATEPAKKLTVQEMSAMLTQLGELPQAPGPSSMVATAGSSSMVSSVQTLAEGEAGKPDTIGPSSLADPPGIGLSIQTTEKQQANVPSPTIKSSDRAEMSGIAAKQKEDPKVVDRVPTSMDSPVTADVTLPGPISTPEPPSKRDKGKQPESSATPVAHAGIAAAATASSSTPTQPASTRRRVIKRNPVALDPLDYLTEKQMPFPSPTQVEDADLPDIPPTPVRPLANLSIFKVKPKPGRYPRTTAASKAAEDRVLKSSSRPEPEPEPEAGRVPAAPAPATTPVPARPKDRPFWRTVADDDESHAPSTAQSGGSEMEVDETGDAGFDPAPAVAPKIRTPTVRFGEPEVLGAVPNREGEASSEPMEDDQQAVKSTIEPARPRPANARTARKSMGGRLPRIQLPSFNCGGSRSYSNKSDSSEDEMALPVATAKEAAEPGLTMAAKSINAATEQLPRQSSMASVKESSNTAVGRDAPVANLSEHKTTDSNIPQQPEAEASLRVTAETGADSVIDNTMPFLETENPMQTVAKNSVAKSSPEGESVAKESPAKGLAPVKAVPEKSPPKMLLAKDSPAKKLASKEPSPQPLGDVIMKDVDESTPVQDKASGNGTSPIEQAVTSQRGSSTAQAVAPINATITKVVSATSNNSLLGQTSPMLPLPTCLSNRAFASSDNNAEAGPSSSARWTVFRTEHQASSKKVADKALEAESNTATSVKDQQPNLTADASLLPLALRTQSPSNPATSVTFQSIFAKVQNRESDQGETHGPASVPNASSPEQAVVLAAKEAAPVVAPNLPLVPLQTPILDGPPAQAVIPALSIASPNETRDPASKPTMSGILDHSVTATPSPAHSTVEGANLIVIKPANTRSARQSPEAPGAKALPQSFIKPVETQALQEQRRQTRGVVRGDSPKPFSLTIDERVTQWASQMSGPGDTALNVVDRLLADDCTGDQDNLTSNDVQPGSASTVPKEQDKAVCAKNVLETIRTKSAIVKTSLQKPVVTHPDDTRALLKGLSFERFGDPLLQQLNVLARDESQTELVRTIMEAYISQACLDDQGKDITIAPGIVRRGGTTARAPPAEFVYSNDMFYGRNVAAKVPSKGCACVGPCQENSDCFCLKRQEKYFASHVYEGGVPYTGFGCHEDGRVKDSQYPIWECSDNCGCPPSCRNRSMQRGRDPKIQLEIFETRQKGWGVKTKSHIAQGTFIGIYSGELVPEAETDERGRIYNTVGRTYLFDLDNWHISQPPADLAEIDPEGAILAEDAAKLLQTPNDDDDEDSDDDNEDEDKALTSFYTIDAFHWGFTRYLNHSCDPNLAMGSVYYDDFDVRKPKLCITARRDIASGTELTISYTGEVEGELAESNLQAERTTSSRAIRGKGKNGKLQDPHTGSVHVDASTDLPTKCHCKAPSCTGNMFRTPR